MSETAKGPAGSKVFDVERVRKLVELMKEHDLNEIDLREDDQRIRLCRGPKDGPRHAPPPYYPPPPPPPAPAPGPAPASTAATPAPAKAPAGDGPNIALIKCPMVGTYYSRPNPKAEAFVKVGSKVDKSSVVCIVEAMKVFNEIQAEVSGTITAILVEDGEAVDFEKPLFKVDTSQ